MTKAIQLYFVVTKAGWWLETYQQLSERYVTQQFVTGAKDTSFVRSRIRNAFRLITYQARQAPRLLRNILAAREPALVVATTAHYAALLAAGLARLSRRRICVYLCNFYLHDLGNNPLVSRFLSILLRAAPVGMLVQSPDEVAYFQRLAPQAQIHHYPLGYDLPAASSFKASRGDYVFASGATNRDYDTVVRAAAQLPELPFVIVRSASNRIASPLPPNVRVFTDVSFDEFGALMAGSRLVVIPLRSAGGSSGQLAALQAMRLGKAIAYADYPTVAQYFVADACGIAYQPGDETDLTAKLARLTREVGLIEQLETRAQRAHAEKFTRARFEEALLADIVRFASGCGINETPAR